MKAWFVVASKEAGLGLEESDVRRLALLALVSVFERTWTGCGGFAGAVMPGSGQRYDMIRGAMKAHTFLPLGTLLVGGDGSVCTPQI